MRGIFTRFLSAAIFMLITTVDSYAVAPGKADTILPLHDALRATYTACVGIDDELAGLKRMAGINTAVTGVGTAAGIGATVTGFVKAAKDKQMNIILSKLRELEEKHNVKQSATPQDYAIWIAEFDGVSDTERREIQEKINERNKLLVQSKRLGNWRTGLLAGNTATNIAGAAISGTNKVSIDLMEQINSCISAVDALKQSMMQARLNGEDITEAQQIADTCGEFNYVDISPINNRATNAMISSIVGATTGLAGTVTSAVANSDKTRAGDGTREKNLNTASNVLAIGATTSSAVATVFNATQISAIKKVADVAAECTRVLK